MVRQAHHERDKVFIPAWLTLSESKGRRVKAVHGSTSSPRTSFVIPFTLSLSKGEGGSWFDKPVLSLSKGSPRTVLVIPFALSLSKGEGGSWFDKLTTNGYWLFRSP